LVRKQVKGILPLRCMSGTR